MTKWEKLAGFLGQSVRESFLAAHGLIIVRIISNSLPTAHILWCVTCE